jgi:uncharacterized protein YrzB (UPF0473 family)
MEKKINNVLLLNKGDGEQTVYRVLFTYYSEKLSKDFAVFYNEADENDLVGFSFDENKTLYELKSDEEFSELNSALEKFDQEQ